MNSLSPTSARLRGDSGERGSILLTALLIATAIGIGLAGYIKLSYSALKLSQRTYYLSCTASLAEAGLEEAIYCFRLADAGSSLASAWSGWTRTGSNASFTLPSFTCGPNAIGVVKVYVAGYDGTDSTPSAYAQATITPFDGSPVVTKTLKVGLKQKGAYNAAIITTTSMSLGTNSMVDSFNSNPTGSSNPTRLAYPGNGSTAKGNLIALAGTLTLGNKAQVNGNVLLGASVTAPAASQVNGTIIPNYTGTYPSPDMPSWPSGSGYYGLWSFPATLPRSGDSPAADGRYHYYPAIWINPITLGATTITAGTNVSITATSVSNGLTIGANATCMIWTGNIATSGSTGLVNPNWAGALQIYSWGTSCSLAHTASTSACIYAPRATVTLSGGGGSPSFTGSIISKSFSCPANWVLHYDESLNNLSTEVGIGWSLTNWSDLQGTAEKQTLAAVTGNFLR